MLVNTQLYANERSVN